MKRSSLTLFGCKVAVLAVVVITASLTGPAYSQTNDVALLLQQTPIQGGTISPDVGVHNFELNAEVALTAVPKPGYQFVYWIGNVREATASSTVAYLDGPKIIIAVFERAKFEFLAAAERSQSAPIGGLKRSAADYSQHSNSPIGGKRPKKWSWPKWPEQPEPKEPEDFPVPGQDDGNDFPVPEPIPEPATVALLVLGSLFAFTRRRPGQQA